MNILFTGANGFLGRNIIPRLCKNYQVYTLGLNNKSDFQCNIANEIPHLDCHSLELVFHAAGKAHSIPKTEIQIQEFYDVNFNGTKNLCKALENTCIPKVFIYISTVAVYGIENGEQISEDSPLNGTSPYAKSKILAENFLTAWCKKHHCKLIILRPSLIAGPHPPGNLRDMIFGIQTGRYFNINGGKARKSVFFVEDFTYIIENISCLSAGAYNVCDSQNPSFGELSEIIAMQLSKKKPLSIPLILVKLIARVGDIIGPKSPINSFKLKKITNSLTFSNKKIKNALLWEPSNVIQNFKIK